MKKLEKIVEVEFLDPTFHEGIDDDIIHKKKSDKMSVYGILVEETLKVEYNSLGIITMKGYNDMYTVPKGCIIAIHLLDKTKELYRRDESIILPYNILNQL